MAISREECLQFIEERNGKIFSVRFMKRTTGEIRKMVCRLGVKSGLVEEPSKPPTDWKAHSLIPVYDMEKKAYKCIPIEGILEIKIDDVWHPVQQPKPDPKLQGK